MLIQMPRGTANQPRAQNAEDCSSFEAALRRDLASAPVVSYDPVLGGWQKRTVDLVLTLLALPLWLPLMLGAALISKLRHSAPVFVSSERIGYGGRPFRAFALRIDPPSAKIERLRVPGEEASPPETNLISIVDAAEGPRAKWRRAFERLPSLFNVLAGDMALVGPSPLTREELEPLKTAKRYYLSARPGAVSISPVADADTEEAGQYKIYALSWSLLTDALLMWESLRTLRNRGELWKPDFRLARARAAARDTKVVIRRRSPSA